MFKLLSVLCFSFLPISAMSQVVFNWGIDNQLYYQVKIANEFKKTIESKTQNRVKINISLYDAKDEKYSAEEYIRRAIYGIHQTITGNYIRTVPEFKIFEIPFLFESEKHIEAYLSSSRALEHMAKLETADATPVGFSYAGGFLFMLSRMELNTFKQLKGLKCYAAPNYGYADFFLKYDEVLGDRNIVSEEAVCAEFLSAELDYVYNRKDIHELYINTTGHRVVSRVTMVSKPLLAKLDQADRTFFKKELSALMIKERQLAYEGARLTLLLVRQKGAAKINLWSKSAKENERLRYQPLIDQYKTGIETEYDFVRKLARSIR